MKKEERRILRKLQKERNLTPTERALYARCLAATPDERWEMNMHYVRSLGLSARELWKAFGSQS